MLALIQKLLLEGKVATQREAYYCLVQYFKNQGEFNDTLQGGQSKQLLLRACFTSTFKHMYGNVQISCILVCRCGSTDRLCPVISGNMCQQLWSSCWVSTLEGMCSNMIIHNSFPFTNRKQMVNLLTVQTCQEGKG